MYTQFKWAKAPRSIHFVPLAPPKKTPPDTSSKTPLNGNAAISFLISFCNSHLYASLLRCMCVCVESPTKLAAHMPPLFATPNHTPLISICCSQLRVATKCFIAFCCVILLPCTPAETVAAAGAAAAACLSVYVGARAKGPTHNAASIPCLKRRPSPAHPGRQAAQMSFSCSIFSWVELVPCSFLARSSLLHGHFLLFLFCCVFFWHFSKLVFALHDSSWVESSRVESCRVGFNILHPIHIYRAAAHSSSGHSLYPTPCHLAARPPCCHPQCPPPVNLWACATPT